MHTICPNCRTQYQGAGYCSRCSVQLVDYDAYMQWLQQQQPMPLQCAQQPPAQQQLKKKPGLGVKLAIAIVVIVAAIACIGIMVNYTTSHDGGNPSASQEASRQGDSVVTSQPEQAESADRKGEVLYDSADMTVTYGGLTDSGAGAAILSLTIENKTGENVSCIAEPGTMSVNDYNIESIGGADLQAGKRGVAQFVVSFQQAGISNLDEIESVSMNLELIALGESADTLALAPITIRISQ